MTNAILFKRGKIAFQILLTVLIHWLPTNSQLNLYNTHEGFHNGSLQFDCLNYWIRHEIWANQDLSDVFDEVISYCFRPEPDFHAPFEAFYGPISQNLSFKELRNSGISVQQLLSWSAPLEVAERYQFYLDEPNSALDEQFYNCTPPWFGLRCQYSLEFSENLQFNQMVLAAFVGRQSYSESPDGIVQVSCYVLLKCHRNGQPWCLDWREVCDGNIDCFDDSIDEQFCFDMEMNQCSNDEYRCHNGLCISGEFWENGLGETDCLDRSDRIEDMKYTDFCFQDPTFRCEEHSCRINDNSFSCGDGQCVPKSMACENGRHRLLINSFTLKGNLTDECWTAMTHLTGLVTEDDWESRITWLTNNSTLHAGLNRCEPFFQFPTIPVHSNHIGFFYGNLDLRSNTDGFLMPDYVCFDQQLCDSITDNVVTRGNRTCQSVSTLENGYAFDTWDLLMSTVAQYFRVCLISHFDIRNKNRYYNHSSLHNCRGSSKFISTDRIMDGLYDCYAKDDENYTNSCQLNNKYRVQCLDTNKCWSPTKKKEACALNGFDDTEQLHFSGFCDGFHQYFYDKSQNYSDEDRCEDWLCNNMYTRCDGFWTCSDGRDEYNCSQTKCPPKTFACISSVNYTVTCLPSNLVNDGTDHCLGGLDEQNKCRTAYDSRNTAAPFRCQSSETNCLPVSTVCNQNIDCADGDDEDRNLCKNQQFKCDQNSVHNRSEIEEIFCGMNEIDNRKIKSVSLYTSSVYPSSKKDIVGEFNYWPTDHYPIQNDIPSEVQNNTWPWYCNRGLVVYGWTGNNGSDDRKCICPPSYYGHLCQYQNQRVSLTLRLTSNDRRATYAVISMLMDDTDERQQVHAYDQFLYVAKHSCSMKLNRYLLFSSRPKNNSHNYSVRIDVLEKHTMTYVGSWHFPIAFLFLPVNRLSVALNLSNHILQYSSNCSNHCIHGECVQYVNQPNYYFCHCPLGWSGIQCNIRINCQACSNTSKCIGSSNNRPICACPIDRYGQRCLLKSTCPINACQNNGQCVPADISIPGNNYTCICPDRFFGLNCEYRKAELDVSLVDISIPTYIVAYFFTLSNTSDPIETTVLRKLTLFQRIVTFHIAIPFQLTFIEVSGMYYLAVLQQSSMAYISTSINAKQQCPSTQELLNSTVLNMISYRRIIHLHRLCQTNYDLTCFVDDNYLCLCTNDRHANCLEFNPQKNFVCPSNKYCENGGQCLQDHPTCPSTKICLCRSCFFGNQCQFYAKGLGSTLDEILGYEFKRNKKLSEQPHTVIISAIATVVIFFVGMINSILSLITFLKKGSRDTGCGIYLLISSITSLLTMSTFLVKFWFLFYSHQDGPDNKKILTVNCFGIEVLLKMLLYLDAWLNACVAVERVVNVILGPSFNQMRSKRFAVWVILSLITLICCFFIPQLVHLHVFYDDMEERSWCVVKYVGWLAKYSSALIFFHYFTPLLINIISLICIILLSARRRSLLRVEHSRWYHLKAQIIINRHSLISSAIIVCLTLPYLVISIVLDCQKSSNLLWFYLMGYFLSFLPSAFVFIIFVLPSSHYKKEFYDFIRYIRRRIEIIKLNRGKL